MAATWSVGKLMSVYVAYITLFVPCAMPATRVVLYSNESKVPLFYYADLFNASMYVFKVDLQLNNTYKVVPAYFNINQLQRTTDLLTLK